MKICYIEKNFAQGSLAIIDQANEIIEDYRGQGYDLTLRQLYYQFVSRGLLENTQRSYKKLGSIINDARLAGLIDWTMMVDRTRNLRSLDHWETPENILEDASEWYQIDRWKRQSIRPEVWIEKDALVGVIEGVCQKNDVSFFSCRGYTSQSEMWRASQRMKRYSRAGQTPLIIHLGDHDPSGIDMSRDILERINVTFEVDIEFERIALNMDQVQEYNPPPNPAKITDTRAGAYIQIYGNESWELDALEPRVMEDLIQDILNTHKSVALWEEDEEQQEQQRQDLLKLSERWEEVQDFLND